MLIKRKCKKSFKLDLYEFEAGKYYEFYRREIEFYLHHNIYDFIYYDEDNKLPIMYDSTANDYFYTNIELRQEKIKMILK